MSFDRTNKIDKGQLSNEICRKLSMLYEERSANSVYKKNDIVTIQGIIVKVTKKGVTSDELNNTVYDSLMKLNNGDKFQDGSLIYQIISRPQKTKSFLNYFKLRLAEQTEKFQQGDIALLTQDTPTFLNLGVYSDLKYLYYLFPQITIDNFETITYQTKLIDLTSNGEPICQIGDKIQDTTISATTTFSNIFSNFSKSKVFANCDYLFEFLPNTFEMRYRYFGGQRKNYILALITNIQKLLQLTEYSIQGIGVEGTYHPIKIIKQTGEEIKLFTIESLFASNDYRGAQYTHGYNQYIPLNAGAILKRNNQEGWEICANPGKTELPFRINYKCKKNFIGGGEPPSVPSTMYDSIFKVLEQLVYSFEEYEKNFQNASNEIFKLMDVSYSKSNNVYRNWGSEDQFYIDSTITITNSEREYEHYIKDSKVDYSIKSGESNSCKQLQIKSNCCYQYDSNLNSGIKTVIREDGSMFTLPINFIGENKSVVLHMTSANNNLVPLNPRKYIRFFKSEMEFIEILLDDKNYEHIYARTYNSTLGWFERLHSLKLLKTSFFSLPLLTNSYLKEIPLSLDMNSTTPIYLNIYDTQTKYQKKAFLLCCPLAERIVGHYNAYVDYPAKQENSGTYYTTGNKWIPHIAKNGYILLEKFKNAYEIKHFCLVFENGTISKSIDNKITTNVELANKIISLSDKQYEFIFDGTQTETNSYDLGEDIYGKQIGSINIPPEAVLLKGTFENISSYNAKKITGCYFGTISISTFMEESTWNSTCPTNDIDYFDYSLVTIPCKYTDSPTYLTKSSDGYFYYLLEATETLDDLTKIKAVSRTQTYFDKAEYGEKFPYIYINNANSFLADSCCLEVTNRFTPYDLKYGKGISSLNDFTTPQGESIFVSGQKIIDDFKLSSNTKIDKSKKYVLFKTDVPQQPSENIKVQYVNQFSSSTLNLTDYFVPELIFLAHF